MSDIDVGTARRRRRSGSTRGVPFDRGNIALEFYPSTDDAGLVMTSGQAFTKNGAPTLVTNGYAIEPGDSIRFAPAVLDAILAAAASPTGFTVFCVIARPVGVLLNTVALANSILSYNDGVHFPLTIALDQLASGSLEVDGDIAYNVTDYEGGATYGTPPVLAGTVFAMVYDRLHIRAPLVAWSGIAGQQHAGNANEEGRLKWYDNGVLIVGDGFAPPGPVYAPEVSAGTIDTASGGNVFYGDDGGTKPVPRIGSLIIYKRKLNATEVAFVTNWLLANKPVAPLTFGPGDLTNNPFVMTNTTVPVTGPPIATTIENADVAQPHSTSTTPIAIASGQVLTRTVYLRANGRFRGILFISTNSGGANRAGVTFNLNTQTLTPFTSGAGVLNSSSITYLGQGWSKIQWNAAQNGGDVLSATCLRFADNTGLTTYNGDGVSGFYII